MLPLELSELVCEKVVLNKWQGKPINELPYKEYVIVQRLNLYSHFEINSYFIDRAVRHNDKHFIRWLWRTGHEKFNSDLIITSASCGRVPLTEWLWEKLGSQPEHANFALAYSAKYGHTSLVEWAFPKATDYKSAIQTAASNGHTHILEWFSQKIPEEEWKASDAMIITASNGHLCATKWLHERFPEMCEHGVFDWAAGNGHHHIVEWLHWHCQHQPCSMVSILVAARRGNLKMVRWLYDNRPELAQSLDIIQQVAEAFEQKEISEWIDQMYVE